MGSQLMLAPEPIVEPVKPKRKRKPPDYAQLVLPRTGRLTRAYWLLREGFVQDVREDYVPRHKGYDWRTSRYIGALVCKGLLEESKGPRGGKRVYRTSLVLRRREGGLVQEVARWR
jgi:hypothetical protein